MCVQYRGGVQDRGGDILSTVGVFSTVGDIMINVGDSLSTMGGYLQYRGGCSVPWGDIMSTVEGVQYRGGEVFCYLRLNTLHGTHDIPHMHHDIPPRYSNFKGWHPPTVLSTPHGTHDILHGTEHPPRYSR